MFRLIAKTFAHHHPATPIETIGRWNVYNLADVEAGWPHNGHRLALEATKAQLEYLRLHEDPDVVVEPSPLPEPVADPERVS